MDAAMDLRSRADRMGSFTDQPDPWLEELLPVCYDPFRLSVSGGLAAFGGHEEKGLRWLRRAAELAPDDANVLYQLGHLYLKMGRLDEAETAFERTLRANPKFSDGWLWRSEVLAAKGLTGASGRVLLEGLEQCPDSPGLHLQYGRSLLDRGRVEAGEHYIRESIRLRPNEAAGYNSLVVALMRQGRDAEAIETLHQALAAEPGNPFALSSLAFHVIGTASEAEAADWVRRCRAHPRVQGTDLETIERHFEDRFGHPAPTD